MARGPLTFLKSDLVRALKSAKDADLEVARVEIDRDGKIVVIMDKPNLSDHTTQIVL